ncbi:hemoglobin subunit alpha-D-like isoform X1 [Paroedura picta]|uniref:hemoglobin subunit alpha-D-like isoform X1 n=1 Tax=Paroedura picta TaxID=143630 RepID=UPI004056DDC6
MLTADERRILKSTWDKVASCQDEIGAESLYRLFVVYPTCKTYFPHFDFSCGSAQIRNHGKKVIKALEDALKNADHLHENLAELSNLHAYNLRVDPVNFKLLARPGATRGRSCGQPAPPWGASSFTAEAFPSLDLGGGFPCKSDKHVTPTIHPPPTPWLPCRCLLSRSGWHGSPPLCIPGCVG